MASPDDPEGVKLFGTGGQLLSELKRLLGNLDRLQNLQLTDLMLDRYEAKHLLDEVLLSGQMVLRRLSLVNVTTVHCPIMHVGLFLNLQVILMQSSTRILINQSIIVFKQPQQQKQPHPSTALHRRSLFRRKTSMTIFCCCLPTRVFSTCTSFKTIIPRHTSGSRHAQHERGAYWSVIIPGSWSTFGWNLWPPTSVVKFYGNQRPQCTAFSTTRPGRRYGVLFLSRNRALTEEATHVF